MNAGTSRYCVILSLLLSLISFILSLTAFYLPHWKSIQLRWNSLQTIFISDEHEIDPLIRGEVEKYTELLYRQGDRHTFGLLTHCITGTSCGENRLLIFDELNYEYCHNIKYHHECIFSHSLSSSSSSSEKCFCQKPFYMKTSYTLLILLFILQSIFLFSNFLRLCRRPYYFYKDLQLRIIIMIAHLFSFLFLLIIIIEQNRNRLFEPLEFFQSMHRHYSRIQIYSFSNNLELILKQIEQDFHVHFGASYVCLIFVFIFSAVAFLASTIVEIQLPSELEKEQKQAAFPSPPRIERFSPVEETRFPRQTKV